MKKKKAENGAQKSNTFAVEQVQKHVRKERVRNKSIRKHYEENTSAVKQRRKIEFHLRNLYKHNSLI